MTTHVVIPEFGTSDQVLPLALATAIVAASEGALTLSAPVDGGAQLSASQHVGVVAVDNVEVRIVPKVPMANVLGMLAAVTGLTSWLQGASEAGTQNDLLRTTIAFYARILTDTLASGVQRAYVTESEWLVGPRGRIGIDQMVRRGGVPIPIHCTYDDLTADTLLNRYLVAALDRARRVPGLDQHTRRLLRHARSTLAEVAAAEIPADAIDRHTFTRLDDRYRPAAALARLLLERLGIHHRRGRSTVRTFTVDMHSLFEQWVAARLPDHLPRHLRMASQTHRHLDTGRTLRMYPDLELQAGTQTVHVADTKYKLTTSGLGRISDYYQAHAYATVLGLPRATLIYCDNAGTSPQRRITIKGAQTEISTFQISLDGDSEELEQQLALLAVHLEMEARPLEAGGPGDEFRQAVGTSEPFRDRDVLAREGALPTDYERAQTSRRLGRSAS